MKLDWRDVTFGIILGCIVGVLVTSISIKKTELDNQATAETTYKGDVNLINAPPGSKFVIYCEKLEVKADNGVTVYQQETRKGKKG